MKFKLPFILLLTACTANVPSDSTQKPETQNPSQVEDTIEVIQPYVLSQTDKLHIDFVQYLDESDEYALTLIAKDNSDMKYWYDSVEPFFDDIIYRNDPDNPDYTRYRIPDSLVRAYFLTDRLKNLKLYDEQNKCLGVGEFRGFEYINQNIEPKCVAVFKLKSKNENALYAVTGLKDTLPEIAPVQAASKYRLDEVTRQYLPEDYKADHCLETGLQDQRFYAVQGYHQRGYNSFAKLFLEENGKLLKVHTQDKYWFYRELHPLPIVHEGHPVLLCEFGKSETCWIVSQVLKFSKGKYSVAEKRNRL